MPHGDAWRNWDSASGCEVLRERPTFCSLQWSQGVLAGHWSTPQTGYLHFGDGRDWYAPDTIGGVSDIRIRVAGLITEGEKILLVEHARGECRYWLPPGGGVEQGETLTEALARELNEETGAPATVGELSIIAESIEPDGRHVLNMVFRATLHSTMLVAGCDGRLVSVAWHEKRDLANLTLFPPIAETILAKWDAAQDRTVTYLGNVWIPLPEAVRE